MSRLAEIESRIAGMDELHDIVGAMRSLAGMRIQESQRALPGIRSYAGTMAKAIASALRLVDAPASFAPSGGRRALIVCLAEHGFVGGFNEKAIEAAAAARRDSDLVFALGSRGTALLRERGVALEWTRPMPTRIAGATELASGLAAELYARLPTGEIDSVEIQFGRTRQGAPAAFERSALFPLDRQSFRDSATGDPPLHNLAPRRLVESLIAEYVFARLAEAIVESIAAENAARFAAMEQASENVAKTLGELRQSARQARQSEITEELLDLVTGAEAITSDGDGHLEFH